MVLGAGSKQDQYPAPRTPYLVPRTPHPVPRTPYPAPRTYLTASSSLFRIGCADIFDPTAPIIHCWGVSLP
jgi:hypothetical protein